MFLCLRSGPKFTNKCVVCRIAHGIRACDAFKKLQPIDHYKKVEEAELCFWACVVDIPLKIEKKNVKSIFVKKRDSWLLHRSDSSSKPNTKGTETVETHASVSLTNFAIPLVNEVELSNNSYRLKVLIN